MIVRSCDSVLIKYVFETKIRLQSLQDLPGSV